MESYYTIDQKRNLVTKTHLGKMTVDDEIKLINQIVEDSEFRKGMAFICDFEKATADWELNELDRFRVFVSKIKTLTGDCRWALVFPEGKNTATARIFVALHQALEDTITVELFRDFESATEWALQAKVADKQP
jgi:hypothetical protein